MLAVVFLLAWIVLKTPFKRRGLGDRVRFLAAIGAAVAAEGLVFLIFGVSTVAVLVEGR